MINRTYGVIVCPHCHAGRIIELGHKTTTCLRCGKRLQLDKVKIQFSTHHLAEAQQVLGQINADQDGNLESFKTFLKSSS